MSILSKAIYKFNIILIRILVKFFAELKQITKIYQFSSDAQSCLTLWPHGLQHARLPCQLPTPRAWSNSCPSSRWYQLYTDEIDLFEWEFKIWLQAFLSIHVCYRYHLMHSIHVEGKQILFSKQLKLTYWD